VIRFTALESKHDTLGKHANDGNVIIISGFSVFYQDAKDVRKSVSSSCSYSCKTQTLIYLDTNISSLELIVD
jgi:hypothetical protein